MAWADAMKSDSRVEARDTGGLQYAAKHLLAAFRYGRLLRNPAAMPKAMTLAVELAAPVTVALTDENAGFG
eukprot:2251119-Alexandrium_andersonii.AAC.1